MTELTARPWPEVPAGALVLLPVGSTEQHGPHLPFDTDTVIAQAVARSAAARLPDPVLVAPALAYGASGEHQGFPGTVSMGSEALRFVLVELVRSLDVWAGRVVVVNGHGGNLAALGSALRQLREEGHDAAWVPCGTPGSDAHAGFAETSLMLELAPARVGRERPAGPAAPIAELLPRLMADGVRPVSPNGVLGDTAGASAEDGVRILEAMTAGVVRRVAAGRPDENGCLREPQDPGPAGPSTAPAATAPGAES